MARPRKGEDSPSIEQRLFDAFWSLAKEPCSHINVSTLCARAGCNRTSFYYHYLDVRGFARRALELEYRGASGLREAALFLADGYQDDEDGLGVALSLVNPCKLQAAKAVLEDGYVTDLLLDLVVDDWIQAFGSAGASGLGDAQPLLRVLAFSLVGAFVDRDACAEMNDPYVARFYGQGFRLAREAAGLR